MTLTTTELANAESDVATLAAVVNGAATDPDVISRTGEVIKPLAKVLAEAATSATAIVASAGYEPPVNYAAGINVIRASQTVYYGGETYAALPTAVPFVTGAGFDPTQWKLLVSKQLVNRATMKATAAADGDVLLLVDALKTGPFRFTAGNIKPYCDADPLEGLFIKPAGGDGSTGGWVRVIEGGWANADWWGYAANDNVAGGSTDNLAVLNAAAAALKGTRTANTQVHVSGYGNGGSIGLLIVGPGYVSGQIAITHALPVKGFGRGIIGTNGTQLRWPANTNGFLGDVGCSGASIEHMTLIGGFDPTTAGAAGDEGEFSAITKLNKMACRDLMFFDWQGDGVHDYADAATSGGTHNTNDDETIRVYGQYCRNVYNCAGGDVNGKRNAGIRGISNRQAVVYEHGFLGNHYSACGGESNGFVPWVGVGTKAERPASGVWYNNGGANPCVWVCLGGNEVWCKTNPPPASGDHNQGWAKAKGWAAVPEATANAQGIPSWVNGIFVRPGMASVIHQGDSNRSTFAGIYSEDNQTNQFDLSCGEITGNMSFAYTVNAGSGGFFSTFYPHNKGGTSAGGKIFAGTLGSTSSVSYWGDYQQSRQVSLSDLEHQYYSAGGNNFLEYNGWNGSAYVRGATVQVTAGGTYNLVAGASVLLAVSGHNGVAVGANEIFPQGDNAFTLGLSSNRWSVVYAASATILTSDLRHKTDIESVSDKVLDAWGEVEWRQFRFKDAKEAKKSKARLHFGLVAQHVRDTLKKNGVDGFALGLLCYDKWDDVLVADQEEVEELLTFTREIEPPTWHPKKGRVPAKTEEVRVPHTRIRAKVDAEGKAVMKVQTAAGDAYGVRYEEALALEAAYQRREVGRLEKRLAAVEKALAKAN